MSLNKILHRCTGVKHNSEETEDWRGKKNTVHTFVKVGDIVVPDDVFIEITATATKGTIARVVELEVDTYKTGNKYHKADQILTYGATIIYAIDGRKQKGRIATQYTKALVGQHQTKFVRDVQTHEKVEVKNPVNKYKQEMQKGDWVIGVKPGKGLGIGRITRWTNHNVWAVKPGAELTDKTKEFKFDSINETFTAPDSEQVQQLLTVAILKGYKGG